LRNRSGRAERFIIVAERAAHSQRGNAQGKVNAANAWTADRGNLYALGTFLDAARAEARDFGVVSPRFTFAGEIMAAARERDQRRNDESRQRTLNTTQHNAQNAWVSVKDCSMFGGEKIC
jgi:hypothetical protein